MLPRPLIVTTLIGATLGIGIQGIGSRPTPPEATQVTAPNAAGTPTQTAQTAAFDPCTLVTTTEAEAILEKQVTTWSAQPLSALQPVVPQCKYTPQGGPAIFQFQEGKTTAQIRIDAVVITVVSGKDATTRWNAKQATFGRDRDDQPIAGLGDKAIYTGGQELSVLQDSSFINVSTQSHRDWGAGTKRYEDVHQQYLKILQGFARPALQRLPGAAAAPAPTQAAQTRPAPAAASAPRPAPGASLPSALIGAIAGLALGALALLGIAARRTTT